MNGMDSSVITSDKVSRSAGAREEDEGSLNLQPPHQRQRFHAVVGRQREIRDDEVERTALQRRLKLRP